MKKIKVKMLAVMLIGLTLAFGVSACEMKHTHNYTETVTAPTCTTYGYTTYTCECGENYIDNYVDALGHEFINYVSNNDASYGKDGTKTAFCENEGCEEKDIIPDEHTAIIEKVLILDASVSMYAEVKGESRFDRAIEKIEETVKACLNENCVISLILADESPRFIAQREPANFFLEVVDLDEIECSYVSANMKSAISLAETITSENSLAEVLLYTGINYQGIENIEIVNLAEPGEWNAAILDGNIGFIDNFPVIEIDIAIYGNSNIIDIGLEMHDGNGACYFYKVSVECRDNEEYKIVFINKDLYEKGSLDQENIIYYPLEETEIFLSYESILISIINDDSLLFDNQFSIYKPFNFFVEKNVCEVGEQIILQAQTGKLEICHGIDRYVFTQFPATFIPVSPGIYSFESTISDSGVEIVEIIFVKISNRESNIFRTEFY